MDFFGSHYSYDFNNTFLYDYYYDDHANYTTFEEFKKIKTVSTTVSYVIAWIVIWIGFPLTLLAIYALYSLVREDHVAPVYVINLLISDLIQMCCLVIWVAKSRTSAVYVSTFIYYIGVMASVGFMVCIALERYLVIACPLWYRFRRSIKYSLFVSMFVWALSLIEFLITWLTSDLHALVFRTVFLLLPFPLLIFFLAGTLKALSAAISVPLKEKRRIVGTLVLVLLNYTVLFCPWVIRLLGLLYRPSHHDVHDSGLHLPFLRFSPLADLVLYVFMRKGVVDKLLAHLCCRRMRGEEEQGQVTSTDKKDTEETCSV
ncbi:G-protein coupled receptor 4-like [Epinephelus fuscoguttatus]|uniref:G-protein coupled receptor 4-like n=1 Tax=Epinephelus fuscoguttatus TaxID=293821 RepID=UPI0020D09D23|nr:G-protein coupled receptor 4-like [Epinephelus fuscoguttatus]